nr:PfkB family carbohydrate kinase [Roseateles koreensis]
MVDEFHDRKVAGGAPFNVARSLAALVAPAKVLLLSALNSDDTAGQCILASMRRFHLDEAGLQLTPAWPSGRVSVSEQAGAGSPDDAGEGSGAHVFTIHGPAAWEHIALAPAQALLAHTRPRIFYFGSLAQRSEPSRRSVRALAEQARAQAALCYLDLNLRPGSSEPDLAAQSLSRADWVKVSEGELAQLFAWFGRASDAELDPLAAPIELSGAVDALQQRFGLRMLVLTRGAAGYAAFGAGGQVLMEGAAAPVPRLVDTVGAGDAFSAMLLAATLRRQTLVQALALANRYAAALCGERGPIPDGDAFFAPWRAALAEETRT